MQDSAATVTMGSQWTDWTGPVPGVEGSTAGSDDTGKERQIDLEAAHSAAAESNSPKFPLNPLPHSGPADVTVDREKRRLEREAVNLEGEVWSRLTTFGSDSD
jgi:hypothetical protein